MWRGIRSMRANQVVLSSAPPTLCPSSCRWTIYRCRRSASSWSVDSDTGIVSQHSQPLFQTVIGMEIHAQLDIPTKLFSSAPGAAASSQQQQASPPNTAVWPLDVAVPGVLPRLSLDAVHAAVLTAAACRCTVPPTSRFERKHYAYADLPLGYQVTQQRWPIARYGVLRCRTSKRKQGRKKKKKKKKRKTNSNDDDKFFSVLIDRIQLEQDTGKTLSAVNPRGDTVSLVDFNRAGCALVEIVMAPTLRSSQEAASTVSTLRNVLRHIGTCDGKMEEGSLRCDLNVSIAPIDNDHDAVKEDTDNPFREALPPGTGHRVEVKNLNSLRQVVAAAEYEALRQAQARANGKPTERETRTFDVKTGRTVTIRTKGGAVDYRFMPEPDLPPVVLSKKTFQGKTLEEFVRDSLPELPEQATERLMEQYGLSEDVALVITSDPPAIQYYERAVEHGAAATRLSSKQWHQMVANWLCNDLLALIKESVATRGSEDAAKVGDDDDDESSTISVQRSTVTPQQLSELLLMIQEEILSTTMAKKILTILYKDDIGKSPRQLADEKNWKMESNTQVLQNWCRQVLSDHATQLEQYKQGGKHVRKMKKFFLGKAMAQSQGKAHPERLQEALLDVLEEVAPGVQE